MNKISMDKEYQTISGRAVEIYRVDSTLRGLVIGAVATTGGLFEAYNWTNEGKCHSLSMCLMEKPSFDASSIPWNSIEDALNWVAMESDGSWNIYDVEPEIVEDRYWIGGNSDGSLWMLKMPKVDHKHWRETLCQRPQL